MKKRTIILLFVVSCIAGLKAQQNISVDHFTGTANVNIPIYTIQENGLNIPIGLNYAATGIKVKDVSGTVGLGWNLVAGGNIAREVRGIPDDYDGQGGIPQVPLLGWLHNNAGSKIAAFNPVADNDLSNCFDVNENTDYLALENIYAESDTEPDIFYINTPFISGKFLFDNNKVIQVQPYQNITITYQLGNDNQLISFTILDDNGIKYVFDVYDYIKKYRSFSGNAGETSSLEDNWTSPYVSTWHLSKIIPPQSIAINFNYKALPTNLNWVYKSRNAGISQDKTYTNGSLSELYKESSAYVLASIDAPSGIKVEFEIASRYDSIIDHKLTKIKVFQNLSHLSHEFDFYYNNVYSGTDEPIALNAIYENRSFLSAIHRRNNNVLLPGYSFDYYGVYENFTKMPHFSSSSTDFWGYLNGIASINNGDLTPKVYFYPNITDESRYRIYPLPATHVAADSVVVLGSSTRNVNSETVYLGSLSRVVYPTGGNTRLYYESNEYLDSFADSTYLGGGIRIKKTLTHDGLSHQNDIQTTYNYEEDDISTGRLISRPAFAFGKAYDYGNLANLEFESYEFVLNDTTITDTQKIQKLSILTNHDKSDQSQIVYRKVSVAQSGKGKVIYTYQTPAMIGDVNVNGGEWNPSEVKIARSNAACYTVGNLRTGANIHPFAYNPNYDFQRGLFDKVEQFGENGKLVSSSIYEYQRIYRSSAVDFVHGLKMEQIATHIQGDSAQSPLTAPHLYQYSKYQIFSNVRNVVKKVTERIYELDDETKFLETITNHEYSNLHKRPNKRILTNSDGSVINQYTLFPEDYDIQNPSGDEQTKAISTLLDQHIYAIPIEQYSTLTPYGGSETMLGGSLSLFDDFNIEKVLPSQQMILVGGGSLLKANFTPSSISNTGGTSVFGYDTNYLQTGTILSYDALNNPETTIGRDKIHSGIHWGYNKSHAHASFNGASANQAVYTGFETSTDHSFDFDPSEYGATSLTTGRTGRFALSMETGSAKVLTGTFDKKDTNLYLFSAWISSAITPGSLTLTFKDKGTGVIQGSPIVLNYGNDQFWKYYEASIDVSSFSSELTIELTTNQNLTIDDMLLYPFDATVTYSSLDEKQQLTSVTSNTGITTYYEYDELGRSTIVRDDDQNILSSKTYTDVSIVPPPNPYFRYLGLNSNNECVFKIDNQSQQGYTYFWTFDENNNQSGTDLKTVNHTYSTGGVKTIQLTVSKDGATERFAQTLDISLDKSVDICAAGPSRIDKCSPSIAEELFEDGCYNASGSQVAPTVFSIDEIGDCSDCDQQNKTYNWEVQQGSSSTWVSAGTDSSISLMYNNTFKVRCIVAIHYSTPAVVISNIKEVYIHRSSPTCPELVLE